jgi:hypothetical protein
VNKPDSGSLFRQEQKRSDKSPDYSGSVDVVCPHCRKPFVRRLAGWVRTSKKDQKKYLGLALSEPKTSRQQNEEEIDF